jgi:DNA gyrase/topoisomerase IV subunit A
MEILSGKQEMFFLTSSGRAKRVEQADFPVQGRYGKGVIAWKLPEEDNLAGMTVGKGNLRVTIHLKEYAPKSARLDDAPLQTRTAQKGKDVVDVRKGDQVTLLTIPWDIVRPISDD